MPRPPRPPLVPDHKAATWARIQSRVGAPDVSELPEAERTALLTVWHAARFAQPNAPALRAERRATTWARIHGGPSAGAPGCQVAVRTVRRAPGCAAFAA